MPVRIAITLYKSSNSRPRSPALSASNTSMWSWLGVCSY
jgi:hypothetical protein